MTMALREEHSSELLLVFLKETWMIKHLLEKLRVGVQLIVYLELLSWKSEFSLLDTIGIIESLEGLAFENVSEHLSVVVCDVIDKLGGESFSLFGH